jgi:hypothetical protein
MSGKLPGGRLTQFLAASLPLFAPDGGRADALIFIHAGFRHIQQRWIIRCQLASTIATITESGYV